jgi:PAS domain S-box-containing protein
VAVSTTNGGRAHAAAFLVEAARIGGEVGRDLSTVHWAATDVGHPDDWPTSLKVALRIVLTSRFSMWLAWGPELTFFCNDAYRQASLGDKYPWALGRSAREVWAEIWPDIGPRIASVLDTGRATWDVALPLFVQRRGFPEETYHTFSYSPLHDDDGRTAGMLCVASEDTDRVLAQRRMELAQVLVEPGDATGTEAELCAHLTRHLGADLRTLPFSLVYLAEPAGDLRLAVAAGIAPGHPAAPHRLCREDNRWPVAQVLDTGRMLLSDLPQRFAALPTGAWDRPPVRALLTPLPPHAGEGVAGVFIAALNPYCPPDRVHPGLIDLMASQIASAIATARAYTYQRRRAEELAEDASWRRLLMETIQDAMQVTDAEGYLVEVNDAFRELVGFPVTLPQPKPHPWWPDPQTDPDDWAQVAAAHQAIRDNDSGRFTVPFRHADGRRLWVDVMYGSFRDPQTGRRWNMGTFRDVTARTRLAERAATLTRVTTRLAEITDVDTVLADGARELQAAIAATSVHLALVPEDGPVRAVEAATAPDARAVAQLRRIAAARALQVETTENGLVTGIGAPVSGEDLGATVWLEMDPPRRMTTEDHNHIAQLCASIAHAVLRARAYDLQRTVALTLQRSLLGPSEMPSGFAARYSPAVLPLEVGGDWYDVVELDGDKVGVVVGDCIGKGLEAATVMGQLRSACRALLLQAKGPAEVLAALDDFAELTPNAACTSVFCAVIDRGCGHLEYSAAGHPPGVLVHPDHSIELLGEAHSVPLATLPGTERRQASATLRPGSVLAVYTDGLVERRREHLDNGIDRLTAAVAVAMRLNDEDAMAAEVLERSLPASGHADDVALLLYRHRNPTPFHARLAPDAAELAVARSALRAWLAAAGVAEDDAVAVLIAAGEACANAMEHGYGFTGDRGVELRASIVAGRLDLEIRDEGVWKVPTDRGNRGRGRQLMERLMDRADIDGGPHGTLVRLRKELHRAL